ncbi:hypothetical protein Agabi119p4_9098 [Agaricus bisporus var. burnettii]|uniref:Chorismate mutase domain-containing protein n=1 Tax=Agaricus bisporus var. burnettii TaxID=192524 RepID=A0A8H7EYB9_AGABI|nr:hypothetical protein Agabi119p4_9098 [Agaricus bisporus var. burnettii]
MGLANNGSINKRDNSISMARTQQPHISGFRQQIYGRNSHHLDSDYAQKCYGESDWPNLHASGENRTVSWDEPRMEDDEGKRCCSSLAEVRQGIDAVDEQLLLLLAKRAAYVREAARFKATRDTVDVPSRDEQVIEQALEGAIRYALPSNFVSSTLMTAWPTHTENDCGANSESCFWYWISSLVAYFHCLPYLPGRKWRANQLYCTIIRRTNVAAGSVIGAAAIGLQSPVLRTCCPFLEPNPWRALGRGGWHNSTLGRVPPCPT